MCSTHSDGYTAASSPAQRHFRPPERIFGEFAIIPSFSLSTFRSCIVHSATCCPHAHIHSLRTQRSRWFYAVAHIFYFVKRNPRQRSKLEICQRFEAWPPRNVFTRAIFLGESQRRMPRSSTANVEILFFFLFFFFLRVEKSSGISKFHKLF